MCAPCARPGQGVPAGSRSPRRLRKARPGPPSPRAWDHHQLAGPPAPSRTRVVGVRRRTSVPLETFSDLGAKPGPVRPEAPEA